MAMENSSRAKIIVLTGVTSGLGHALAAALVEDGHQVFGCGRSEEKIGELNASYGDRASFRVLDVSKCSLVAEWAAEVLEATDSIDFLINNAGIINSPAPVWQIEQSEFDAVIDVNVKGVANILRHFLPAMVEQQKGIIVNLISGTGQKCPTDAGAYTASKWAVDGLTKTLAAELPKEMAAISLVPGTTDTPMLHRIIGDRADAFPDASDWAKRAVPCILSLGPAQSGDTLTVPESLPED